jgi:hypothetical protein
MLNGIMLDGVVKASCFPSWIFASWMLLNRVDGPPLMEYNGQLAGSENHSLISRWMVAASCRWSAFPFQDMSYVDRVLIFVCRDLDIDVYGLDGGSGGFTPGWIQGSWWISCRLYVAIAPPTKYWRQGPSL